MVGKDYGEHVDIHDILDDCFQCFHTSIGMRDYFFNLLNASDTMAKAS